MKKQLMYKLYQLLPTKQRLEYGFTLIELLVVIIIIGILSVMGINSFLNHAPKAKQSEAKTAVASINSAQNSYRLEHPTFANTMEKLAIGLPTTTTDYNYNIVSSNSIATINATTTNTALKGYAGAVEKYSNTNDVVEIGSIICEASSVGNIASVPTSGKPGTGACGTDKELGQ